MFENVGAYGPGENRVPNKKTLRELLLNDPSSVKFDCTSIRQEGRIICGDNIPPGMTLVVVLPDPYESRRYYANVFVKPDGSLVVH